ncbi:MAG: selenoneine biosynthesis selenosugar synthase SenB [Planctomycetota bacterium]
MKILIVTPVPTDSTRGNSVTARRWRDMLTDLGHETDLHSGWESVTQGHEYELLMALHAERSHSAMKAYRDVVPGGLVVVVMTGTDLYQDLPSGSTTARASLELATRIVVLHPCAFEALPEAVRGKARLIIQSATPPARRPGRMAGRFSVSVLAHARRIKDPLLAARAARKLSPQSKVHVTLAGGVLEDEMRDEITGEAADNERFTWLGELPTQEAFDVIAASDVLVMSSLVEGGANVISEALAADVPVLAARIPAAIGMLGPEYPGLFAVGDETALADLMQRAEGDAAFMAKLSECCRDAAPLVDPRRERSSLAGLLTELTAEPSQKRRDG